MSSEPISPDRMALVAQTYAERSGIPVDDARQIAESAERFGPAHRAPTFSFALISKSVAPQTILKALKTFQTAIDRFNESGRDPGTGTTIK